MASTFKIVQDGALKTITFSFRLSANGMTFLPMYQEQNVDVTVNGDIVTVTISNISGDNVGSSINLYMEGSSYYGTLNLNLDGYTSSTDINFNYWKKCVTTHSNQYVIADLQCIYDNDKADGNYDDYCTFDINVDGITTDIRLTIEHPHF